VKIVAGFVLMVALVAVFFLLPTSAHTVVASFISDHEPSVLWMLLPLPIMLGLSYWARVSLLKLYKR
jgi:hypothetical protein